MAKKGSIAVQAEIKSVKMNTSTYGNPKVVVSIEFEQAKPRPIDSYEKWFGMQKGWGADDDAKALHDLRAGKKPAVPKSKKGKKKADDTPADDASASLAELEAKVRAKYDAYAGKVSRENGKAVAGAQGFTMLSLLQGQKANVVISPMQQVLMGFQGLMLEAPGDPDLNDDDDAEDDD